MEGRRNLVGLGIKPISSSFAKFSPPEDIPASLLKFPKEYLKYLVDNFHGESALTEKRRAMYDQVKAGDASGLKEHIIEVWTRICSTMHVYCCIERFFFLEPLIHHHPEFVSTVLPSLPPTESKLLHFLDIGAGLGSDVRKLIQLGVPPENIHAIDVVPGYWEAGFDVWFDSDFLTHKRPTFHSLNIAKLEDDRHQASVLREPGEVREELREAQSEFEGLRGRFDFVSAMLVLHVLSKAESARFLERARALLAPGGMLLGYTGGVQEAVSPEGVERGWAVSDPTKSTPRFIHSRSTLAVLLEACGYENVKVDHANLREWSEATTIHIDRVPFVEGWTPLTFSGIKRE